VLDRLLAANKEFSRRGPGDLPALPRRDLVILTCMDHRVDPHTALGLELGDAMVIRNAGGRVTPAFLADLEILAQVAEARGGNLAALQLLLIQHTDCGAAKVAGVADPREALRADVEVLATDERVPATLSVSGLLYDTGSGRIELVDERSPLRNGA
jgi:carbonic anhydrase